MTSSLERTPRGAPRLAPETHAPPSLAALRGLLPVLGSRKRARAVELRGQPEAGEDGAYLGHVEGLVGVAFERAALAGLGGAGDESGHAADLFAAQREHVESKRPVGRLPLIPRVEPQRGLCVRVRGDSAPAPCA